MHIQQNIHLIFLKEQVDSNFPHKNMSEINFEMTQGDS